ncbi:tRNA (pseudouridine(54)-N(1))-methyltransferase TrmY [Halobacteriales archaeon QS_3_64_16]|nr:MAG: tRNA (pseudouridine(54)-N(1))-methyltransferase TrmY [Halobacteriales archaeon QS_3_64_16]
MRQFLVLAHDGPTDPDFSLEDLPGAGRLDVLCRCVTSALLLSHGIREDTRVRLVLGNSCSIRFEGSELRRLNPDERSTAALIRGALEEYEEAIGHVDAESSPGVFVSRRGIVEVLEEMESRGSRENTLVTLHEEATPATDLDPPTDPIFVLSDHRNFTAEESELLAEKGDERVRLSPQKLHANHAITVAHNYLDTAGFERY